MTRFEDDLIDHPAPVPNPLHVVGSEFPGPAGQGTPRTHGIAAD